MAVAPTFAGTDHRKNMQYFAISLRSGNQFCAKKWESLGARGTTFVASMSFEIFNAEEGFCWHVCPRVRACDADPKSIKVVPGSTCFAILPSLIIIAILRMPSCFQFNTDAGCKFASMNSGVFLHKAVDPCYPGGKAARRFFESPEFHAKLK